MFGTGLDNIRDFSSPTAQRVGWKVPNKAGCMTMHKFELDDANTGANLVAGSQAAAVVGSPAYGNGYATLKSTAKYLRLPYACPAVATIALLVRAADTMVDAAHRPGLASGNQANYDILWQMAAGNSSLTAYEIQTADGVTVTSRVSTVSYDPTQWALLVASFDHGSQYLCKVDASGGAPVTTAATAGTTRRAGNTSLMIGSARLAGSLQGQCEVSLAQVWPLLAPSAANTAWRQQLWNYVARQWAPTRSIILPE